MRDGSLDLEIATGNNHSEFTPSVIGARYIPAMLRTVCVFCASSPGTHPRYVAQAAAMGRYRAASKRRIVYGGGRTGLIGAIADAALEAGGEVIGIMPRHLIDREVAHTGLTELRVVASTHERKALLAELSDGFLAMPGGLGTLEELFEIWTWAQLGLHGGSAGPTRAALAGPRDDLTVVPSPFHLALIRPPFNPFPEAYHVA